MLIDKDNELAIFEYTNGEIKMINQFNLFQKTDLFEAFHVKSEGTKNIFKDEDDKLAKLRTQSISLKYSKDLNQLFTVTKMDGESLLATWDFNTFLDNMQSQK